jgi:hypothetical protein
MRVINIEFYGKLSIEVIEKIITKGNEIGFRYFDKQNGEWYEVSKELSINETLIKLTSCSVSQISNKQIYLKSEDDYFFITFLMIADDFFSIKLFGSFFPWQKNFMHSQSGYQIDYARYIEIIMKLCDGFQLKDVCIQ